MSGPCELANGCAPVQSIHDAVTAATNSVNTMQRLAILTFALCTVAIAGWAAAAHLRNAHIDEQLADVEAQAQLQADDIDAQEDQVQEQAKALVRIEEVLPRIEAAQKTMNTKLDTFIEASNRERHTHP